MHELPGEFVLAHPAAFVNLAAHISDTRRIL
jgi:hypothetical protein